MKFVTFNIQYGFGADGRYDLSRAARVVAGADIIALQEVENDVTLAALAARSELKKTYPHKVLLPGNDPRGIDVALLSTVPVKSAISHKDDYFAGSTSAGKKYKYSRDCLEVHLDLASGELVLLVVHFKAKVDDDPTKRLAEAEHTRGIADAIVAKNPAARVVILGDYNDFPGTPPITAIEGAAPQLYPSTASKLGATNAWTVEFNGQKLLHDDQHTNPALTALLDGASVTILHDTDLPSKALQDATDHAPVVATYLFP